MLGQIFNRRHTEIFFLVFSENGFRHVMQIVPNGNNLHEMSKKKKKKKKKKKYHQFYLSSAELQETGKS